MYKVVVSNNGSYKVLNTITSKIQSGWYTKDEAKLVVKDLNSFISKSAKRQAYYDSRKKGSK